MFGRRPSIFDIVVRTTLLVGVALFGVIVSIVGGDWGFAVIFLIMLVCGGLIGWLGWIIRTTPEDDG